MTAASDSYKNALFQEEVAQGYRSLFELGFLPTEAFGDVSVRDPQTNTVYITMRPGTFYVTSPAEYHGCDTAIVSMDGTLLEENTPPADTLKMHLAIYKARPDVNAVVHNLTKWSSLFALRKQTLPLVLAEQKGLGGEIRCVTDAPVMSDEYCEKVVAALEGRKAALLHEFGAVAVAGTVDRAINYLAWLESVARKTLRASLIGTPIVIPMGSPHAKE